MYYKHNLDYKYPDRCDEHMITVKKVRDVVVDKDYPFLRTGFGFKILRVSYWLLNNTIVFPLLRITHGLRIHNKENLKNNKTLLKNGAITVSNHVFMWDFLCVLKAIRPKLVYFPAWKNNLEGSNGLLIRMSGGIPIPTDDIRATVKFKKALEDVLRTGKWMHVYPEGSLWYYYPDIRPLKKGVFQLAVRFDKPIIPISMSFRPRKGIQKWFGKAPLVDLHIAEPVLPDKSLPRSEAANRLRDEVYRIMQEMNGILPGDPTYNTDHDPNNYKKTM